MRSIVYGAGSIGGVVAGHLARTGHEVLIIARQAHADAINQYGLKFITPFETHVLKVPAVITPSQVQFQPDDAVFMCMKSQDFEEAARELKAAKDDVPVFCFQNGVRTEEIASRYFRRVYAVMVRTGGIHKRPGEVFARREPPGWFIIGRYPEGTDEVSRSVAEALKRAGFLVLESSDVMPYKWAKLIGNLSNVVGAITNETGGDAGKIVEAARKEGVRIIARAGVRWIPDEETAREWPEWNAPVKKYSQEFSLGSTWLSLYRQTGNVETDFLNGEIARLARSIGAEAPINDRLNRVALEMADKREKPGKYTAAQLREMIGTA